MTIRGPFVIVLFVVLALSLAVNFTIAGFSFARWAYPRSGGDVERIVTIGLRSFPKELRKVISERTRDDKHQFRELERDARQARRQMFDAMRGEPFDRRAMDDAFAAVREQTNQLQAAGQAIVGDAVAEASPETRKKIKPPRGPFP
jgi:uncharacterized membrane protein